MKNNLNITKKKLSIMFSIIVFMTILWLWISFFSMKYFTEISREKRSFQVISERIELWKVPIDKILRMWDRFERNFFEEKRLKNRDLKRIKNNYPFLNYIHLNKNNSLISSSIKDEIDSDLVIKVVLEKEYFRLKNTSWLLIKKINLDNDELIIIFKKLRYDLSDYFEDILWFVFISFIFTLFIYFIGTKFINRIFIPVEENMDDMKNFIHNAWHELKTPISVIDSNLQLLDDIKKYDSSMNNEMRLEIKKLNSLIDVLVNLSDLDSFKKIEKNNLLDIILEIEKNFKSKINEKKLKLNINIKKDITIEWNKTYFYMFLSNIIWNAIKYNKKDWKIDISYKKWKLVVSDNWEWIKKDDLEKIFDRFYKVDKSRNSEGFWIGLSLVKKI